MQALAATHVRGVPNFRTVNDQVYGGGQPSAEGFRNLAAMGVKTVVDLEEKGRMLQGGEEAGEVAGKYA